MSFSSMSYPCNPAERYAMLLEQAKALTDGVSHPISNLANVAALLFQALEDINWCGFYLMDQGTLMLGPFCGLPACIQIPLGRGVCGTAAQTDTVECVKNVHEYPGHIACDSASNSEIVLPIHAFGRVIGVLDIDSPRLSRFGDLDKEMLSRLVAHLESACDFSHAEYSC